FGSVERFIGILVEHFAGAFPSWLAPVQAAVIPIADRHVDYARKVAARLRQSDVRVEVDESDNTMGAKIRNHQLQKVPYMLVVGDAEAEAETVAVRRRSGEETRGVAVADFAERVAAEIEQRLLELSV
ncbi:MAG: His/Gly/Thr/Pro-type tRNA ligase C-terminal domain-containing protein, partial [Actinomycetota bacterium]|nr:His/Gly/Thr/Pro-type tRNA ligase C-terminal domain-containing protein [Actinomycetota bacterium]